MSSVVWVLPKGADWSELTVATLPGVPSAGDYIFYKDSTWKIDFAMWNVEAQSVVLSIDRVTTLTEGIEGFKVGFAK